MLIFSLDSDERTCSLKEDSYFSQKQQFEVKTIMFLDYVLINGGYVSYKHAAFLFTRQ